MKPNPICITKQKFKFENEGEKEIEKKGIDEIPYTNLCCIILLCLMLLSLPVPLFLREGDSSLRTRLVHCNDYYIRIGISITRNTLNWNVISITIY